jgi:hypothetical protein
MMAPQYPVIFRDQEVPADIQVFRSLDEAESSLEFPDVQDGVYVAWDADGYRLSQSTNTAERGHWLNLRRAGSSPEQTRSSVIALVLKYARQEGVEVEMQDDSVKTMCDRIARIIEERAWKGRTWWRRLLRLPNPIQKSPKR